MTKELLEFCKYYKGEDFDYSKYTDKELGFKFFEQQYFEKRFEDHLRWEEYSQHKAITDFPELKNILFFSDLPIEVKGMLAFSAVDIMYHSPMGGVSSLLEYDPKSNINKYENLHYYRGGNKNPFSDEEPAHLYWSLEYLWYTQVQNDEAVNNSYMAEFAYDFPDLCNEVSNETPLSLKAFMYDQHCHFGGSKEGFTSWFMNYIAYAKFN